MENQEEHIEEEFVENNNPIIDGELDEFFYEDFQRENNNFKEFPYLKDYQKRDLYNMYFSKNYKYNDDNEDWYYLLSKFDRSAYKFLTNRDHNFTSKVASVLYKHLNMFYEEEEAEKEKQNGDDNDGGSDDKEGLDQKIQTAMSEAFKEIEELAEQEESDRKSMGKNASEGEVKKNLDSEILENLIGSVKLNFSTIESFITKTVKSFKEHFSSISRTEYEELLYSGNIGDIGDIDGLEFIPFCDEFPFLWSEVFVTKKILSCVVDCYVDNSGSMTSSCNINENYNTFSRSNHVNMSTIRYEKLSKILAYKLYQKNYLADLFYFDYSPHKISVEDFLKLSASGGTRIDAVIQNVIETKRPSLIISDGEDTINNYSDLAYIINVCPDSYLRMISNNTPAVKRMLQNKQIIGFVDNRFFLPEQFKRYANK